jgi:hypothetical protein
MIRVSGFASGLWNSLTHAAVSRYHPHCPGLDREREGYLKAGCWSLQSASLVRDSRHKYEVRCAERRGERREVPLLTLLNSPYRRHHRRETSEQTRTNRTNKQTKDKAPIGGRIIECIVLLNTSLTQGSYCLYRTSNPSCPNARRSDHSSHCWEGLALPRTDCQSQALNRGTHGQVSEAF